MSSAKEGLITVITVSSPCTKHCEYKFLHSIDTIGTSNCRSTKAIDNVMDQGKTRKQYRNYFNERNISATDF